MAGESAKLRPPAFFKSSSLSAMRRREAITGYLWISPWVIGFVVFVLGPMLMSAFLSFNHYTIVDRSWVGGDNYVRAFTGDDLFWLSLSKTLIYAGIMVPLSLAVSLACALLLNQGLRLTALYRTLFFLPSLTPAVAMALLWIWFFQPQFGPLNYLLGLMGIPGPSWLGDARWAMVALIIMALWGTAGGATMVIFLAGLQGIPEELYDAAQVDGANRWQKFIFVTIPSLTPTIFFNLVLGIIGALKVFTPAYIATDGGPAYATWFYVLHLYYNAFRYFEMGYASALAWIFFAVVLVFTYIQFRWAGRWVYYEGELRE